MVPSLSQYHDGEDDILYFSLDVSLFSLLFSLFSISNWGSESDEKLSLHNGNSEPRGFGEKII